MHAVDDEICAACQCTLRKIRMHAKMCAVCLINDQNSALFMHGLCDRPHVGYDSVVRRRRDQHGVDLRMRFQRAAHLLRLDRSENPSRHIRRRIEISRMQIV